MKNVLVVIGHPDEGSFVSALARTYIDHIARSGAIRVETLVLSELAFDPVLHVGYRGEQALEPDLVRARHAIERADHVAWFFPMWWGSMPALVKGFIDRTFLPGWAFAYAGNGIPKKLLRGRSARFVTTMDSPSFWYRWVYGRSLHGSFVDATLSFVGFAPVRETTIYGVRGMTPEKRAKVLARVAAEAARDAADVAKLRRPVNVRDAVGAGS